MTLQNSKGKIFYGMHFYPGVAEYSEPGKDPYRVFLNEDTIRAMDPSFAGRPIFVEHVDEVEDDIDELKDDADGWVIESFFNSADGKHWVKFIVVSKRAERAIEAGMRLSNAYIPNSFGRGGLWNGVQYAKEITGGEYEHLAIVRNPRYEESVIMTPDAFKAYNESKVLELKRLSNSKDERGAKKMGLKLFKRTKVENAIDIEGMSVMLPKSGKEILISKLVANADDLEEKRLKNEILAGMDHQVKLHDGSMCNVGELLEKHNAMAAELAALKKPKANDEEIEEGVDEVSDRGGDEGFENEEDEDSDEVVDDAKKKNSKDSDDEEDDAEDEEEEKPAKTAAKKSNSVDLEAKKRAKEKAARLKNAHHRDDAGETEVATVEFSGDQVARGKSLYGSG